MLGTLSAAAFFSPPFSRYHLSLFPPPFPCCLLPLSSPIPLTAFSLVPPPHSPAACSLPPSSGITDTSPGFQDSSGTLVGAGLSWRHKRVCANGDCFSQSFIYRCGDEAESGGKGRRGDEAGVVAEQAISKGPQTVTSTYCSSAADVSVRLQCSITRVIAKQMLMQLFDCRSKLTMYHHRALMMLTVSLPLMQHISHHSRGCSLATSCHLHPAVPHPCFGTRSPLKAPQPRESSYPVCAHTHRDNCWFPRAELRNTSTRAWQLSPCGIFPAGYCDLLIPHSPHTGITAGCRAPQC